MRFDGTNFDDFKEGLRFDPVAFRLSAQEARDFDACLRFDAASLSGPAAQDDGALNPVLVANFHVMHGALSWPTGVLHAREQIKCSAAVHADDPLRAEMTVKKAFLKGDKKFLVLEILIHKEQPEELALAIERTLVWPR